MDKTKLSKCCSSIIILLITCFFFSDTARSEVYTVGDADEWSTGTSYLVWSEKYNFTVGDVLVFKYVKGQHDTYEVTQDTYQSCNTSTGVLAKYESGNDRINLTEAKKYWFICDKDGHCFGGMRLVIDVKNAVSSSNNTTTNGTSSTPQTDQHSNKSCAIKGWSSTLIYLLVLGALPSLVLADGLV
ncbi:Blue copper protein [Actinidia chinensis var. chinensis]|uniref:Blue copper protein n=1 Tax=Actinidia chinensis var. chinensis TaxID=1590841 RepID=A0A2R6RBM8_ACTCC|nr:Blue copper protein [Actinidia chinensis var. chinensis]